MANKKKIKQKHVPLRTCVGCREVLPKRSLIRIVRTPEGIKVDPTGKMNGRGAYLHNKWDCWERAFKGSLAHALKTTLSNEDRLHLQKYILNLEDGRKNK